MTSALRLRAENIALRYGEHDALRGVSIDLHAGELVAVLGPNGAGKSSLVDTLSGIRALTTGRIFLDALPLGALDRRAIAQRLAVVRQSEDIAFGFRVRDVVAMGRAPFQRALLVPSGSDDAPVQEVLETCGLQALADRPVSELSGGERRRVAVARALCQATPTMLLDEPTAHLDPLHARRTFDLLRAEVDRRALACLVVVHDLNVAAHYADRVVLLSQGKIEAQGSVSEVMTAEHVSRVFSTPIYKGSAPFGPIFVAEPAPNAIKRVG